MKDKTLVIYKTHIINRHIFSEYKKIARSGYDTLLVVDNRFNIFPYSGFDSGFTHWNNIFLHYFLTCEKHYHDLNLPFISYRGFDDDLGMILWTNSDYTLYLVRNAFPNYKFYWQFDYDCYFNGKDYSDFFVNYENNSEDLLVCYFRESDAKWYWHHKSNWIYENIKKYASFFPIVRLSAAACDFLYKQRLMHGKIFERLYNSNIDKEQLRIIFSELFVPTELMKNNFSCAALQPMPGVIDKKTTNSDFYDKRKFLVHDNQMYHPIKDDKYIDFLEERPIPPGEKASVADADAPKNPPSSRKGVWEGMKDHLNPYVRQDSSLRKAYRIMRSCCDSFLSHK